MNSNKLILTLLVLTAFTYASAQSGAKAIKWNMSSPSDLEIMDVDPANQVEQTLSTIHLMGNRRYVANTLHHDQQNDLLYFFTDIDNSFAPNVPTGRQQTLVIAKASTGERLRDLPFFNSAIMAPFIIGEKNELGFISSQRKFNGYGNNEEDISLVLFNLTTGEITSKIKMPTLSFQNLSAPFVGKMETVDFNGIKSVVEASLSSPCYISPLDRLIFVAKDVTGTNRVFKINTQTGKLVSQLSIAYDVIDMVYDEDKEVVRTLYVDEVNGERSLMLGDLDINTNRIQESVVIRKLESIEDFISDGYVEWDSENGNIYVGKVLTGRQDLYSYDKDLVLIGMESRSTYNEKVDFEFPAPFNPKFYTHLDNVIKMYPNPASAEVTISTIDLTTLTGIRILNSIGEVVKNVDVQSGQLANDFNVSNLTSGIYFVEIESDRAETVTKKLIIK